VRQLDEPSYRVLQWLVAGFALLHNVEEGLTVAAYAPDVRERFAGLAPPFLLAATRDLSWFYVALVVATVVPVGVVLLATTGRPSEGKAWAVAFVQSLFLVNVLVPHIPAAVIMRGYAPGVVTAVAVNLPFSVYFLWRTVRDGKLSRDGVVLALALAMPALVAGLGTMYAVARWTAKGS
jgi:Protein of unknown function with HXXEE motif